MTSPVEARLEVVADPDTMARRVADWLLAMATAEQGRFAICLSGGSTPRLLYETLGRPPYLGTFPWHRAHWFWGDERFVPHEDQRSNYRMVHEALLAHAPIPPENVHAVPTVGLSVAEAAARYEADLRSFYGADRLDPARPLFDVNLLGLGPDGHTASLFPGSPALEERTRWVAPAEQQTGEMRITLTYPALESSRNTAFLVAGEEKRAMLGRLHRADERLPAGRLRPTGELWIFADTAAAGDLA